MIHLKNVKKAYRLGKNRLEVLKGLSLRIGKGELVSIMGPSGSGKSTLLNILGILDNYDSGEYYLDDILIRNFSETQAAKYRNKLIGFVFQSFHLIGFKNALENVAMPLYYKGLSRSKRNKRALEYLDKVGLKDWAHHMPNELSGGQQQRVAIARALITNPSIILADEPTGALDTQTSEEVMRIFRDVNGLGLTVVIVTHDKEMARLTDRIIHLRDGMIHTDERIQEPTAKAE